MKHEFHCPVCGKENDTLQCESCGFDGSRDYERLLTLSRIPVDIKSIAGWKKHRENRLRCKGCGCSTFYVDLNTNRCVCSECGMEVEPEDGMFVRRQESEAPKHQRSLAQGEASRYRSDIQYRRRVLKENWGLILGEALFYIFLLRNLILPYVIEGWMLIRVTALGYTDSIGSLIYRLADFCGATCYEGGAWYSLTLGLLSMNWAPNSSPGVGVNLIAISMLIAAVGAGYLLLRIAKVLYAMWRKDLTHPTCLKARFAILLVGVCGFAFRDLVMRHVYLGRVRFYSDATEGKMIWHYLSVGLILLIPAVVIAVYRYLRRENAETRQNLGGDTRSIDKRDGFTTRDLLDTICDPKYRAKGIYMPLIYAGAALLLIDVHHFHFDGLRYSLAWIELYLPWVLPAVLYLTRKKKNRGLVVLSCLAALSYYVNYWCVMQGLVNSGDPYCTKCANASLLGMLAVVVINVSILRRMGWMDRESHPAREISSALKWWRDHNHLFFYALVALGHIYVPDYISAYISGSARVCIFVFQLMTPLLFESALLKDYQSNWHKVATVFVGIELAAYAIILFDEYYRVIHNITIHSVLRLVTGGWSGLWVIPGILKSLSIALGLKRMKAEHHDSTRLRR